MKKTAPVRWWDLPAAFILLVALYLTGLRLVATNWTEELGIVQTVIVIGTLAGLALGQSIFGGRQAAGFAAVFTLFIIFWQFGLTFGEGVEWLERISSLLGRLGFSLDNLARRRAVTDPILFVFLMSLLFAALSAHAGFTQTRSANAWQTMLPSGIALFIIHIHDPYWTRRSWFLAGYIFLALLLVARVHFLQKREQWRASRTHLPPYVGLDFLRVTMVGAALLILLAWTAPAFAASLPPAQEMWQTISRPIYQARARLSNAFASLNATVGVVQDYYGDILPLGRGNTLTDVIVFWVQAPPRPTAGIRYYWRARSYETWTGSGWEADPTDTYKSKPDVAEIVIPNIAGRSEAEFTFTAGISLATLYAVPQPFWVSRPTTVESIETGDGAPDILRLSISPTIRPGEQYLVRSLITNTTVAQLRQAGTRYPDWVTDRYLQLPDTLTRRTRELAAEITAPYDNPYDQADAITRWLRDNITYAESFPVPPQNRDVIDYLLFDVRSGFCNYYATAEVLLLRAVGIPARLAVGYAQGERDPATDVYTVRQRDAHAWPEVYFPSIGWVEFEPTINQTPINRPAGQAANSENGDSAAGPDGFAASEQQNLEALLGFEEGQPAREETSPEEIVVDHRANWVVWLSFPGAAALAAAGMAWYRGRITDPINPMTPISVSVEKRLRKAGLRPPRFIKAMAYRAALPLQARSYEQINRSLARLGMDLTPDYTPAERASALLGLLPAAREPIGTLLHEYQSLQFAPASLASTHNNTAAQQAARTLRSQTWGEVLRRFFSRFQDTRRRDTLV
jgi:transglutaminase-like putative cysteine protease